MTGRWLGARNKGQCVVLDVRHAEVVVRRSSSVLALARHGSVVSNCSGDLSVAQRHPVRGEPGVNKTGRAGYPTMTTPDEPLQRGRWSRVSGAVSLMCCVFPRCSASVMRDDSPCMVNSLPPEWRLLLLSSTASLLP